MKILNTLFPKRFSLFKAFVILYLTISLLVRISFLVWDFNEVDASFFALARTFLTGLFFDFGTLSLYTLLYVIYLLFIPTKLIGTLVDRILTYIGFFLGVLIVVFSFFVEFTFWDEFHRRFNFIAVDYLVYTYEVVKNINESYPLPILLTSLIAVVGLSLFIISKEGAFNNTFINNTPFKQRLIAATPWVTIALIFGLFIKSEHADWSNNRYNNELSKAGIYSFFAAFRNNELPYPDFYRTMPTNEAFTMVKKGLNQQNNTTFTGGKNQIKRNIVNTDSTHTSIKPNIIFICIESLSGEFLNTFGSTENITPTLDSLAQKSIFFSNLYATGTRTVRGMEAITLSIPPTPGRSIVKRKNNTGLFTIGEVFKNQGYERNFFYGGDGYFDNMNSYFGGNGFNIVDRGRGFLLDKSITTTRTNIEDHEVTFENAWGVCDEDIYNKVLSEADNAHTTGVPFFNFIMTTSNHKPYTYPEGKIDIPSGTGRSGAVKYTDFAIGEFIKKAKSKAWFSNTVFVIMSDHCASSAGRWELDVANYHIPALIFNLPEVAPAKINQLCSQIDLFPTLFGLLNWDYTSNFYGLDVLKMQPKNERAFIGNYRKLGLLKNNQVLVLGDQNSANFYNWKPQNNTLETLPMDADFLQTTISYYQTADYLYSNGGLKTNPSSK